MMLWMVNSPLSLYLIFGLFLSIGFNMGFQHATAAVAAKWFIRKRGRALAFIFGGNGIGGAIFVPVLAWLIIQFGWRWTAVIIGLTVWTIVLPLSLFVRSTPEEVGLLPDGQPERQENSLSKMEHTSTEASASSAPLEEVDFSVRDALKTPSFWIFAAAVMLRSCIVSAMIVHQIPHLTDIGIPYQTASAVLGLMVLLSIPGRFLFGWLGDLFNKKVLLFLLCLLQGAGIFIFIHANTLPLLYLFVVIFGLGYGGVITLTHAFRADLFGRRNYATIAGMVMPLTAIGTVVAPLFAGYLYDVTQSYSLAFYTFIVIIILSGILFLSVPHPAPPHRYLHQSPS